MRIPPMKRSRLQNLVRWLLPRLSHLQYQGLENIPPDGPVIVVTNHLSQVDTPVLFINPIRPDITALVADKYRFDLFMRWFTESAGGIWIDRSRADFGAFRAAQEVLHSGRVLGIAPEGTRSKTGGLLEGKSGSVLIALKAGCPIVPVGQWGTEKFFSELGRFRRTHITCRFGPAFSFPPLERENRDEMLQQYTTEMMLRIAALLPEQYRGFYRDHPRLGEFLSDK